MSHTEERIEMVKLLQRLREDDEKPGATVLRALRALEAKANKENPSKAR